MSELSSCKFTACNAVKIWDVSSSVRRCGEILGLYNYLVTTRETNKDLECTWKGPLAWQAGESPGCNPFIHLSIYGYFLSATIDVHSWRCYAILKLSYFKMCKQHLGPTGCTIVLGSISTYRQLSPVGEGLQGKNIIPSNPRSRPIGQSMLTVKTSGHGTIKCL